MAATRPSRRVLSRSFLSGIAIGASAAQTPAPDALPAPPPAPAPAPASAPVPVPVPAPDPELDPDPAPHVVPASVPVPVPLDARPPGDASPARAPSLRKLGKRATRAQAFLSSISVGSVSAASLAAAPAATPSAATSARSLVPPSTPNPVSSTTWSGSAPGRLQAAVSTLTPSTMATTGTSGVLASDSAAALADTDTGGGVGMGAAAVPSSLTLVDASTVVRSATVRPRPAATSTVPSDRVRARTARACGALPGPHVFVSRGCVVPRTAGDVTGAGRGRDGRLWPAHDTTANLRAAACLVHHAGRGASPGFCALHPHCLADPWGECTAQRVRGGVPFAYSTVIRPEDPRMRRKKSRPALGRYAARLDGLRRW
jgi:hypothetical protein